MAWNFSIFNLLNWKITLPVDDDYFTPGGGDGDFTDDDAAEVEGDDFEGFEESPFFYYNSTDQAMVFRADVDGATTSSGTKYARSELREMTNDGEDEAAWSLSTGGTMSATLRVDAMPTEDDSDPSRIIVGQIHATSSGSNDELVRLYYRSDGVMYFANEHTGTDGEEREFFFKNANGDLTDISLGETFSYIIEAQGSTLNVQVYADGEIYSAVSTFDGSEEIEPDTINSSWQSDAFYFKAGVYLGVNDEAGHAHEGTGYGQASFFGIDFSHTSGEGANEWPPASGPNVIEGTSSGETLNGTTGADAIYGYEGNDTLKGQEGADILYGAEGDDILWGNDGDDVLDGGSGANWLKGGPGADTYVFNAFDGADTVADFSRPNGDLIDVSALLDGTTGFVQASAIADGYIQLEQNGSDTELYLDLDGSAGGGARTLLATLEDETASAFTQSDFILPDDTPSADILGDASDNTLTGTSASETLKGYEGNDTLNGLGGDDILWGNEGNDVLDGGSGANWLKGGPGADTFIFTVLDGADTIADFSIPNGDLIDVSALLNGVTGFTQAGAMTDGFIQLEQNGSDTELYIDLDGTSGSGARVLLATLEDETASSLDTGDFILPPDSLDEIHGTSSGETLNGDSDDEAIYGYGGNDTLKGQGGDDYLYGGEGDDNLWGNDGADILNGGAGADWIKGGSGIDTYVYTDILDAGDTVAEFRANETIDLTELVLDFTGTSSTMASAFESEGYIDLVEVNSTQTDLYIDMDGTAGGGSAVLLASFMTETDEPVTLSDLLV